MAVSLLYRVAALSAFLVSSTVLGVALPENGLGQRSDNFENGTGNSLKQREVGTNDTSGSNRELKAELSAAASTIILITMDQTTTVTGFPPGASTLSPASTIYTPPTQPFAISTRSGTRLFPTSAITIFVTPTFVFSQTQIVTQTVTTLYVIDATRTSTFVGVDTAATVLYSTSIGYNCASTNPAPPSATKALLSGISKSLPLFRSSELKHVFRSFWIRDWM